MIELAKAREFARQNGGVDAAEIAADYHGASLYRLIPFEDYKDKKTGYPILFAPDGGWFSLLTRKEVDEYLAWRASSVRFEDDE